MREGSIHAGPKRLLLAVLVIGTVLRVALAATVGLGVDESYAVVVARTPSWAYFDHPGLSFWIPGLLARATGSENALLLRAPFILMFAGTTWVVFRLGEEIGGARAGAIAALLLAIAPVFTVAAGGWVLPDGPLDLFMAGAVLCLAHAITGPPTRATRWWLLAGGCAAGAALSKYQAIFLPIGVALFFATRRASRRALSGPGPIAATLVAALGAVPTVAWNASHGWASFAFQLGRGAGGRESGIVALLENVAGQALYLLPWLWVPLVVVLARALRRGPADAVRWLLCCMAAPPIAFFTLVSLGGSPGLPHWPMVGYLMVFPLLGDAVARRLDARDRRARRWLVGSVVAFGIVLAAAWSEALMGWMHRVAPSLVATGGPAAEMLDWADARPRLAVLGVGRGGGPFVAAVKWMDAGKIGYTLGPDVPVLCLCGSPHHFGYLADQRAFLGRDAVLIDHTRGPSGVRRLYAPYFARIDSLPPIIVRQRGRPVLSIHAFFGRQYRAVFPGSVR
ncbi:MAG TPA: glycosyltransferase family 39 protein [Gemmatimonadaceae bacterium]|nr:glycosyltransferase family 39 protein [Gemmatimonadaceae bacterium]